MGKKKGRKRSTHGRYTPPGHRSIIGPGPPTPQLDPSAPGGLAQQLGFEIQAESLLLSLHQMGWQKGMRGAPANVCIGAVMTMQRLLPRVGLDCEPVTVFAEITHANGQVSMLGDRHPRREAHHWTGHLALWVPTINRFFDPTIYQGDRGIGPGRITTGIVLPLPELAVLGQALIPKGSHLVKYGVVEDASEAASWREGADEPDLLRFVAMAANTIHEFVVGCLRDDDEGRSIARSVTTPAVSDALLALGVR